jgi:hypothetical protein
MGHALTIAERTPERLGRLARRFDLVWATSWQDDANEYLAPLFGLPELPVVRFSPTESFALGDSWKLAPVQRFVRRRPAAWLDDELGHDVHACAAGREAPTLPVDVAPDCGLCEEHVARLLAFADRCA